MVKYRKRRPTKWKQQEILFNLFDESKPNESYKWAVPYRLCYGIKYVYFFRFFWIWTWILFGTTFIICNYIFDWFLHAFCFQGLIECPSGKKLCRKNMEKCIRQNPNCFIKKQLLSIGLFFNLSVYSRTKHHRVYDCYAII